MKQDINLLTKQDINLSKSFNSLREIIPCFVDEQGRIVVKCESGLVAIDIHDITKCTSNPELFIKYFDTFTIKKGEKGYILFFKCKNFNKSIIHKNGRILGQGETVVICSSTRKIVHYAAVDECTKAFLEEGAIIWISPRDDRSDKKQGVEVAKQ